MSLLIFSSAFLILLSACSDSVSPVVEDEPDPEAPPVVIGPGAVITLDNSGAQAYLVLDIEGEGASAELDEPNPEITLEAGMRYTFINESGASSHPLDFRNADNQKLFGQSNQSGLLDDDESVDVERDGNLISFNLTEELAEVLANYVCSFHPGMGAAIIIE
ncbi:MAG: hypothetical protein LAT84_08775 [Balneolia bacterium]|nr:hypothetical protein [Balneolia bacterium]